MRSSIQARDWSEVVWYLRFFFGRYSDEWYASLFTPAGDRVRGEITPAYSILESRDIERIKEMMPEVKLLYIIRNPVDRTWSAIKYNVRRASIRGGTGQSIDGMSLEDLRQMADSPGFLLRGDYVRTIRNWRNHLPEEQLFISFFDDIVQNPEGLLQSVFEFLGVDSSKTHITQRAYKRANISPSREMPTELRIHLAEHYYPQVKVLSEMLGGHAIQWRHDVEQILGEMGGLTRKAQQTVCSGDS
jgi:hypothetical protein